MQYGISKTTAYSFRQAVDKVTEELKKEGFGVLNADLEVGLCCNVIVYERNGNVTVSAFDPAVIGSIVQNETLYPHSRDVRQRLQNVMTAF